MLVCVFVHFPIDLACLVAAQLDSGVAIKSLMEIIIVT